MLTWFLIGLIIAMWIGWSFADGARRRLSFEKESLEMENKSLVDCFNKLSDNIDFNRNLNETLHQAYIKHLNDDRSCPHCVEARKKK